MPFYRACLISGIPVLLPFMSLTIVGQLGAWPVLPYSVLEIVLLGGAFYFVERRAEDWERLTIAGDRVVVEQAAGGKRQRHEFNRYWLRVEVESGGFGRSPQVMLRSGGASWAFGGTLPVAERLAVAQELRRLTGTR